MDKLLEILTKGKNYEIGHISTWAGGQRAVKHQDGWVLLGGSNHGKLKEKESGPVTHKELADKELPKKDTTHEGSKEIPTKTEPSPKDADGESTTSNLVGSVDFSNTPKKVQAELYKLVQDADTLVTSMGITFKTPIKFRAKARLTSADSIGGSYKASTNTLTLESFKSLPQTVMHEIGHAVDYSMQDKRTEMRGLQDSQGRSAELDTGKGDLASKYKELFNHIASSKYYSKIESKGTLIVIGKKEGPFIDYLREPTEAFARAFEVYSYEKAKKLEADGKLSKGFTEKFVPDVYKTEADTTAEMNRLREASEAFEGFELGAINAIRDIIHKDPPEGSPLDAYTKVTKDRKAAIKKLATMPKYKELKKKSAEALNTLQEASWRSISPEHQKEYGDKIVTLMDYILKNDKVRKSVNEVHISLLNHLNKSIMSNPMAEIDINTAEQSQDEIASRGSDHWVMAIDAAVSDAGYGDNPESIPLPQSKTLYISKVDNGIYSGIVKNEDESSGEYGTVVAQLSKMTPEAMVQALKSKGFIFNEPSNTPAPKPESDDKYSKLKELLDGYTPNEVHIHIEG